MAHGVNWLLVKARHRRVRPLDAVAGSLTRTFPKWPEKGRYKCKELRRLTRFTGSSPLLETPRSTARDGIRPVERGVEVLYITSQVPPSPSPASYARDARRNAGIPTNRWHRWVVFPEGKVSATWREFVGSILRSLR